MNEPIQELAEQAMVSISYSVCPNTYQEIEDPTGPHVRQEFSKDKFAELIIRECAESIRRNMNRHVSGAVRNTDYNLGLARAASLIEEHFGVK